MHHTGAPVKRSLVTVGERQVEYRRAGEGPVVVLCHESPLSSASLVELGTRLAARFTVLALDTPGYGGSDPLAVEQPEIEDYADALAETLTALGVERTGVYGAHTGASIALELALRHPARVAATVLDGLPLFSAQERVELIANYLPTWPPEIHGGHLLALWTRYRDQHLFFPWYRRDDAVRLDIDMPDPEHLHDGIMDLLRAGDGYRVAYAAAFRHRTEDALRRAATGPLTVVAREDDLLAPQLDRMPEGVEVALLPRERDAWAQHVGDRFAAHPGQPGVPAPQTAQRSGGRLTRQYLDTRHGRMLARSIPEGSGRPLVLLHAAGASGAALVPLMQRLAPSRPVITLDTLGNGDSDAPTLAEPEIGDHASAVVDAIDALGLDEIDVYGAHTGACIAIETAIALGPRACHLIAEGVQLWDERRCENLLANATPSLEPRWDGAHLVTAWALLRDRTLFWPWYERTRPAIRRHAPADAASVHAAVVDLLKAGPAYPLAFRATFRFRPRERLPLVAAPTLVCTVPDDVLHRFTEEAGALAPRGRALTLPPTLHGRVEQFTRFLDAGA